MSDNFWWNPAFTGRVFCCPDALWLARGATFFDGEGQQTLRTSAAVEPNLPTEHQSQIARAIFDLEVEMQSLQAAHDAAVKTDLSEAKRLRAVIKSGFDKMATLRKAQADERERVNRERLR